MLHTLRRTWHFNHEKALLCCFMVYNSQPIWFIDEMYWDSRHIWKNRDNRVTFKKSSKWPLTKPSPGARVFDICKTRVMIHRSVSNAKRENRQQTLLLYIHSEIVAPFSVSVISNFSCWAIAWAETISARRFRRGVWSPLRYVSNQVAYRPLQATYKMVYMFPKL